ncbi:adenylyltransferase/cytidyltransferase family protein [uncultured Umboniibacter sp.]|uniref:adenylyltransferase/cytidyltransferase family protein n=1 Tax=uncultured Umboniibacter sp. TaxID=1798917 RepID=UPI00344996C5
MSTENPLDSFIEDVILPKRMMRGYYRLLYIFQHVMNQYDIEFFAHSGTMLGAVRHKGIIPWDDDLDVMIEESFEDLLIEASTELERYGIMLKEMEHDHLYQFKCSNPNVVGNGYYLQIDVFIGKREVIGGDLVLHYKSPKFKQWFSKRFIRIEDLYPLKTYEFGPITVKGVGNPTNYFNNSGFDLDTAIVARHQGFDKFLPVIEALKQQGLYPITNHYSLHYRHKIAQRYVAQPIENYLLQRESRTVITYGTFDLFHVGHVRLLKRLRALGDRLIVGVSSDEFNLSKGKKSFYSFAERKEILEATDYVDSVFAENDWEQKRGDIIRYKASIFGMGDDWSGEFDSLKDICDVVYLPRTEEVSTTDIKNALAKISEQDVEQLESSLHAALEVVSSLANSVKGHR